MTDEKHLSPYRPIPEAPAQAPRQTWFGRFAWVRRWLGGRWEFRAHEIAVIPDFWKSWVRVNEFTSEPVWRDGSMVVSVIARQDEHEIRWARPLVCWLNVEESWQSRSTRRRIGGRWEMWMTVEYEWSTARWVPVNEFTFGEPRIVEREHWIDRKLALHAIVYGHVAISSTVTIVNQGYDERAGIVSYDDGRAIAEEAFEMMSRRR